MFYKNSQMVDLFETASKIKDLDIPVLITGETGSGKEIVANFIHSRSVRASFPFVKVNCAALPSELIESLLFGSRKGAFTSSNEDKDGLFVQAGQGTIMLDELCEMNILFQSKLLRVLQERVVQPIGSNKSIDIKCRIIAATNQPPEKAIESGKLRKDLFYRLNVINLKIPNLDSRRDEIPDLANFFLDRFKKQYKKEKLKISDSGLEHLSKCNWPGNVRQLENEVIRAAILSEGEEIGPNDFANQSKFFLVDKKNKEVEAFEREQILAELLRNGYNQSKTAKVLGLSRPTIRKKIQDYDIEMPNEK